MTYSLGVDLGAATCAAAVGRDGIAEPCALGDGTATMPSAALVLADGSVVVGEEADGRSPYEPPLVARMVTGRLGEAEPITVDGVTCDPLALTEALLRTVVDRCVGRSGEMPAQLVLTFPLRAAAAEPLLHEAARRITGTSPVLVPEPIAAVATLAEDRDLGDDTTIAVVDVGASSVDVTLVRRTPTALDLIGEPASRTDIAGTDIDAAVLALVEGAVGDVTSTVRAGDHAAMRALRRLRASCRRAKEGLSTVDGAVVEVVLPATRGQVEITRAAFDAAAAPAFHAAVDLVLATIDGAGLSRADVGLVLVTGGSARIPLLSRLLADRTRLTVVSDDRPDLTVSLGATLFAHLAAERPAPPPHRDPTDPVASHGPTPVPFPGSPPDDTGAPFPGLSLEDTGSDTAPVGGGGVIAGDGDDAWSANDRWEREPAAEWHEAGTGWDDSRTSVFDPPPPPPPSPTTAGPSGAEDGLDEFQRLTTSDTDRFRTRSGTYLSRAHDRDHDYVDEDDGGRPTDLRLILGGVVAAAAVLVLGAFILLAGAGSDSGDRIAVADTVATTASTSPSASTSTTVASTSTTTEPTTTTTTEEPTTPTRPRSRSTTPTTAAPAPPPPPTAPPTTSTTQPPPTTTEPPTSTTSTTDPACPHPPPPCNGK